MKIAYEGLDTVIEISTEYITELVIENAAFLYQMLTALKCAADGEESEIVISKDDRLVSASKTVSLVTDFVSFSLNQKSLISKIIGELDRTAKNGAYYQKSQELLASIESYMLELTMDFSCELICEKLNMQGLLKGMGLSIADDYDALEERLLAYMDLAREFEGKELFIFVNMRCLIPHDRLQLMVDTALVREYRMLLIDNMEFQRLKNERRIVVDEDLCVI